MRQLCSWVKYMYVKRNIAACDTSKRGNLCGAINELTNLNLKIIWSTIFCAIVMTPHVNFFLSSSAGSLFELENLNSLTSGYFSFAAFKALLPLSWHAWQTIIDKPPFINLIPVASKSALKSRLADIITAMTSWPIRFTNFFPSPPQHGQIPVTRPCAAVEG